MSATGPTYPLTRRSLLKVGGTLAAGGTLALASCSRPEDQQASGITIPDSGAQLPEGDVTYRHIDSGDDKAAFWKAVFAAYEDQHPNITCQYDGAQWARVQETLSLGVRNGTAHDVFQMPAELLQTGLAEGWGTDLSQVVPDFDAWVAAFPPGALVEGRHYYDGVLYNVPTTSSQRYEALIHYNTQLMEEAGYDPTEAPLTIDEYRDAARKITKQGNGRAYGVVLEIAQPARLEIYVNHIAHMLGVPSMPQTAAGINPLDGRYVYASDGVRAGIDLLLALQSDGSLFPGSASLTAPEAWPRVLRGQAGMVAAGPWVGASWEDAQEDPPYGVSSMPVPDADAFPMSYPGPSPFNALWAFSGSKLHAVAGDLFSWVFSPEGGTTWSELVGFGAPSIFPEAREAAKSSFSPQGRRATEIAEQMLVVSPEPIVRNPQVAIVDRNRKPLSPNFGAVLQAILVGEIAPDGIDAALQDLQDRAERGLDDAIAAAQAAGAQVSREDYVFAGWDPRTDFDPADYGAS